MIQGVISWGKLSRICILFLALICASCARNSPGAAIPSAEPRPDDRRLSERYAGPVELAVIAEPAIHESSGLVASRNVPGLYWTHNDSGDGPFLYAFGRDGGSAGVWRVTGATADDWEDIAAGPGPDPGTNYLYIGDIGDNGADRAEVVVYRVPEPAVAPGDAATTNAAPAITERSEAILLRYPDGNHNAEALMVHPRTGDLYVVTKERKGPAGVYRAKAGDLLSPEVHTLAKIADLILPSPTPGMVTGADISPDGRRVILCDYFGGYELALNGPESTPFDEIWKVQPLVVDLGARQQGEAVCYDRDGNAILATSEGRHAPLFEAKRK
jgi:hypothetical protein